MSGSVDPHRFDSLVELENKIDNRIDELMRVKAEILEAVNRVQDGAFRQLLTRRYIEFKTWEQIAVDMNYSYRQVTRMHGRALLALKDVLECPTFSVL